MNAATPARSVLRTEAKLWLREPGNLFWIIAFPAILLGILGFVPDFKEPIDELNGHRLVDLYVSTAIVLAMIMASLQALPVVFAGYREKQILRRYAVTPAKAWHLLFAQILLHSFAVVTGAVLAIVVGMVLHGVSVPGNVFAYLLVFVIALAANMAIGAALGGLTPTAKAATTIGIVIFFPAMFAAGVWFPVAAMSGWLSGIVVASPWGATALALDNAAAGHWPELGYLAIIAAWAIGMTAIAVRWFRWQ